MSNPPAEPTQAASPASLFAGFSRLVRILGQFVAPTTLLTALLFYFGWAHVYWFFDYFGVDSSVLAPSTREYVMRSVDALFIPLITVAVVGLALMWGHLALPERLRGGPRSRWQLIALTAIGILLLLNGLSRLVVITPVNRGLCVAPICIIVGIVLLWYLTLLRRSRLHAENPTPRSDAAVLCEWAVMFILVAMSLFWLATDYSVAVGQTRARQLAAEIPYRPEVVLFSEKDLHLDGTDIRETKCTTGPDSDSAYRFRYDGLVLLGEVGGQYVLLPRNWQRGVGTAIVLPKSGVGATRFEFATTNDYVPPPNC
jgi:hypothetical protein